MRFRLVSIVLLTLLSLPVRSVYAQSQPCTPDAVLDSFIHYTLTGDMNDWASSWDGRGCESPLAQAIQVMQQAWDLLERAAVTGSETSCKLNAIRGSFQAAALSDEIETWVSVYQSSPCGSDIITSTQMLGAGALMLYGDAPEWAEMIVSRVLGVATRTEAGDLRISYGQNLTSELENGAGDRWVFDATSEDRMVAITLESAAFNAYLELYDPQGNRIATNDSGAGSTNARILISAFDQSGQYTIIARAYNQQSTGSYNLSLQRASDRQITFGESLTVEHPVTGGDLWSFQAEAHELMVAVTLYSSDFNAYLELYDPLGNLVATNDSGAGSTNARIVIPVVSSEGLYTIIARSYDSTTRGTYILTLVRSVDNAIEYGSYVDVDAPVAGGDLWSFEAGADRKMVAITLESNAFNAYLELYDPTGNRVATNDSGAGGTNARIFLTELNYSGRYTILARSYDATTVGSYRLTLIRAGDNIISEHEPVYVTDPVAGGDLWTYNLDEASGMIAITLDSDMFNAYLELYDPQGQRIDTNDSGAGGTNARILLSNPKLFGNYTIIARSYDAATSGAYRLTVTDAANNVIEFGEVLRIDNPVAGGDLWSFTTQSGVSLSILLESNSFNAYLELYDPKGNRVATNDSGGGGTNALINYVSALEGRYTIVARSYDSTTRGSYTLTLR